MEGDPIPIDELNATVIDVHDIATTIINSSLAILSLISSSVLIWMIKRSRASFATTYNRILLGMAITDILFSLGSAHFNFTAPSDDSYYVWNASGNELTCNIQGFVALAGTISSLFYNCSLNLFSLACVKYNLPDSYIRRKVEPFLHGVPIAFALIISITLLVEQNINDNGGGNCIAAVYTPPHCIGYEDGEPREGFNIECGRGHDGAVLLWYLFGLGMLFLVPLTIATSLGMIYRSVSKQENNMASYGASNFTGSAQQPDRSNSRLVLHRALAFSIAYFLAWLFVIIGMVLGIANVEYPTPLLYLANIFNPLQGFFNFVIYFYPKVTSVKSKGDDNRTWFQAFKIAFWGGRN